MNMKVDKDELLEWLFDRFEEAKASKESFSDVSTRRYYDGVISAYQSVKFALDTGEIKDLD